VDSGGFLGRLRSQIVSLDASSFLSKEFPPTSEPLLYLGFDVVSVMKGLWRR